MKSNSKLELVIRRDGDESLNATVTCSCGKYPIQEGILVLKRDSVMSKGLSLLRKEKELESVDLLAETVYGNRVFELASDINKTGIPCSYLVRLVCSKVGWRRPPTNSIDPTFSQLWTDLIGLIELMAHLLPLIKE